MFDKTESSEPELQNVAELLERSIELELRAKRLYEDLAKTFVFIHDAKNFFEVLAEQEQDHADMLELCQTIMVRVGWRIGELNPWYYCLPALEEKMAEAEIASRAMTSLEDALRLVIEIESSEVNHIFQTVCAASNSLFVRKMMKFRKTIAIHISYISDMLPKLSPQLVEIWASRSADVLQPV